MNIPSLNRFGELARIKASETESSEKKLAMSASKKSKRQKEKEAAEAKAKQAELDAALAYDDFVKSFDGPDDPSSRFVKAGGARDAYQPRNPRPSTSGSSSRAIMGMDDDGAPEAIPTPAARGKKRAMDSFLEELKRDQADRDARYKNQADRSGQSVAALAAAAQRGPNHTPSMDDDAHTTNIHVHPLPAGITEQLLGQHFARFGSVATVKIFWPRDDPAAGGASLLMGGGGPARVTKAGLGGFVAMMDRKGAEKAIKNIDGSEWMGSILRLGWGKPIPIPLRPAFGATASTEQPSALTSRGRSTSPKPRRRARSTSRSQSPRRRSRSPSPRYRSQEHTPQQQRAWPELDSKETELFLQNIAEKVRRNGRRYEDQLRHDERNNADYAFFFDQSLPSYHYYRMLNDRHYKPPPPLQFEDEGDAEVHSTDSEEASEDERYKKRTVLGKLARRRLERLLRSLTTQREKIGHLMTFAIEHAEAADQVTDLIIMSMMLPATPIPRKLARLYALSDILANSSAPVSSAWKYRGIIENKLPPVFDHFNQIYQSFPGRMKANAFKQQIMVVVDLWETMLIFTPTVIEDYSTRLSGSASFPAEDDQEELEGEPIIEPTSDAPKAGFKKVSAMTESESKPQEDDIDGEAMDLDGEAIPTANAENLDGQPIDEDLDGAPMT